MSYRPPLGTPIDWGHPLAQGLVAWIDADGDRVSGAPLSLLGAAVRNADGNIMSPGGSNDGAYVPFPPLFAGIGAAFSAVTFAAISSMPAYGTLFDVPFNEAMTDPYQGLSLFRYESGSRLGMAFNRASASYTMVSSAAMMAADGVYSCRAVSKSATEAFFYKDGLSGGWSPGEWNRGTFTQSPDLSNRQPLALGNSSAAVGGGALGGVLGPWLVYARALSFAEVAALNANPWAMFARRRLWAVSTDVSGRAPVIRGSGRVLAPSVPLAFLPPLPGAGSVLPPSGFFGVTVPRISGRGVLTVPASQAKTSAQEATGAGYVCRPSARWALPADQLPAAQIIYTLTLTGAADGLADVTIPMTTFQTRLNAGGIHYLSAYIPNSRYWADHISARPHGQWVVRKGYRYRLESGGYADALAEIVRVDYASLSWTRGSSGDSATVTGNATITVLAAKIVDVSGLQYEAFDTSGKRRIRCDISLWLAPGDLCRWFDGQMVAGEIVHRVDDSAAWMEVTEA